MTNAVSTPPAIPGYEHLGLLGRGGYADVFRYTENATQRSVAVKVLHESALTRDVRDRFESELRLMGRLSNHPSIVTLYNQGIAGDGRPYLVMELCPGANLGKRFRSERLRVAEVLRIGVEIAGALETAHMSGILHLDIKPANILFTEYGHPVLADFGIARLRDAGFQQVTGVSVPWAPPEIFADEEATSQASDVWGLAAMLYSLLAGRSPFEIPGGDNSEAALIDRICNATLQPTGRPDLPASVERVLAAGMAKSTKARIQSAAMFARMLQSEQVSLGYAETPLLVRSPEEPAAPEPAHDDDGDGTRMSVRSVRPHAVSPPRRSFEAPRVTEGVRQFESPKPVRTPDPVELTATRNRDQINMPTVSDEPQRRNWIAVVAAVVVLAVGGVIGFAVWHSPATEEAPSSLRSALPTQEPTRVVPPVSALTGHEGDGGIVFVWENRNPEPGDSYRWIQTQTGRDEQPSETSATTVTVPAAPGRTCIAVSLVRDTGRASAQTEACFP
ncbi:serine/threonine-protein kinase [Smaragdicoccus niigatensis]|uniref:serine/threonine-protein kinase n=1 Tax=Smaragdicoccus niigatensis TaxID=359359 RepID=UPI000374DD89|nr:serine/threonine-protein kinase [Smaragdicoccus niigatensis]